MKRRRRVRRQLILFFDLLLLYVRAGFDLAFAWNEAAVACPELKNCDQGPFADFLEDLAKSPRWGTAGRWFFLLATQYRQGVALVPVLGAAVESLRREERLDLRRFLEGLSTRIQILLLLFGLLPALWVLLAPLLLKINMISNG